MKKRFNKDIIIFLFIIMIIMGKFVRYTVMKDVLVDYGSGHTMIKLINAGETSFSLTFNFMESSKLDAARR